MALESINPATGEKLAEFEAWDQATLDLAIKNAAGEFLEWSQRTPMETRCQLIKNAAEVLREQQDELAELISLEMGKSINEAKAEIEKSAWVCEFYAEHGPDFLADEMIDTDASKSYICYQPMGVVLAVMPWNFPFWQVFRFAAPALIAGNIGLLKHASNVPQCAQAIERVLHQAGVPRHAFTNLMISSDKVESVIRNRYVRAVTLTGSEQAGRKVAAIAGEELKKTVLELGGSDAFIVMNDADIPAAIEAAVASRYMNMGQSCIAAKRFIIDQFIYEDFISKLKAAVEAKFVAGDPLDTATTLCPMARQDLLDELHQQVQTCVDYGARLVTGGYQLERAGCYYAPTILADISSAMPAYHEEFFGPVALIFKASEPAHAVGLANATQFGLGGSVWSGDPATAETMALRMESGACFVNGMTKSDPRLPFGGVKNSGYGRELSYHGIREFTNVKSIWIR